MHEIMYKLLRLRYLSIVLLFMCQSLELAAQSEPDRQVERYRSLFLHNRLNGGEFENWNKVPPTFPKGYYYQFAGKIRSDTAWTSEVDNPEMILGYLIGLGVEVEDAWFKGYDANCDEFSAAANTYLAIRLKSNKHSELLGKHGFQKTDRPSAPCPYNVIRYSFSKDSHLNKKKRNR